ncbi:MAG: hypothetical protein KBD63_06300 [Bacteriovoracaceae bacterium]|nr:hypothetical protein [Bacteriovoracaceae bacterium]
MKNIFYVFFFISFSLSAQDSYLIETQLGSVSAKYRVAKERIYCELKGERNHYALLFHIDKVIFLRPQTKFERIYQPTLSKQYFLFPHLDIASCLKLKSYYESTPFELQYDATTEIEDLPYNERLNWKENVYTIVGDARYINSNYVLDLKQNEENVIQVLAMLNAESESNSP